MERSRENIERPGKHRTVLGNIERSWGNIEQRPRTIRFRGPSVSEDRPFQRTIRFRGPPVSEDRRFQRAARFVFTNASGREGRDGVTGLETVIRAWKAEYAPERPPKREAGGGAGTDHTWRGARGDVPGGRLDVPGVRLEFFPRGPPASRGGRFPFRR